MDLLLIALCLSFLKIGAFSFGGGYAVLAFMQKEIIELHQWLAPETFVDIVAIAEMTPGPIAVNASTFVGYNLFGVSGALICSACVLAVPFTLSLIVSFYFNKFSDNPYLKKALSGIRPAVVGIIAAACISVAKISILSLPDLLFFGLALLMVWKFKANPIVTLLVCGALGAVVYGFIL